MIIGHQKQLSLLRQMAKAKNFPHALIFCGEERLGKKRTALEFIKIVNCKKNKANMSDLACEECVSCLGIERGQHEDLMIVEPKSKEIQIDQIRDLIKRASLKPARYLFKFVLIDDAHSMNQVAQTALLKTLEEPAKNTAFILITAYPERLLATIISRSQKIKFYKVAIDDIEKALSRNFPILAKSAALCSFGKPGVALNLLQEKELEKQLAKREDFIKFIYSADLADKFTYVKDLLPKEKDEQVDINIILESWLTYFRELLMLKIGIGDSENILPSFKKVIEKYTINQLKEIIKLTQKVKFLTDSTNVNSRLALEIIMLKI